MSANGQHPTAVAAWAGSPTRLVTLPSGNVAKLRDKFPVYMLLRAGRFTEEMWTAFGQWTRGELQDPVLAAELLDLIVCSMFIEPIVSRSPGEGELSIDVLSDDDVEFVLEGAVGGAPDASFPGERNGDGDQLDGEDVGADPVDVAGDDAGDAGVAAGRQSAGKTGARARKPRGRRAAK